tara:strand:+ start:3492 stop:4616 length:1125 start_codon:yes stop_codon:yes gene_type:complete
MNQEDLEKVESQIRKARSNLLLDHPFFGTLALSLTPVADPETAEGTAATDGRRLYYDPKWMAKQDVLQTMGLIAHEAMHPALQHHTRRGQRDHKKWNVAGDHVINLCLLKAGFILPDGGLHDPMFEGMHTDDVYAALPDEPEGCGWGRVLDAPTKDSAEEVRWQQNVAAAKEAAERAGKMPAHLSLLVEDAIAPLVNWRSVLWPFLQSLCKTDYSWRKPNRAYISEDEYLPSLGIPSAEPFAVIFDTSASITANPDLLSQFVTEVRYIHQSLSPEKLVILSCDTDVENELVVDPAQEFELHEYQPVGGGGTRFDTAIAYVDQHHPDVSAIVYFTDLKSNAFGNEPDIPILWICTERHGTAPFGTVVHIQLDEQE